jgi:hypothetical protein
MSTGVALGVVDLEPVGLEVAHPDTDPAPNREGQDPPESRATDGADVAAEELDDRRLARRDHGERQGDDDAGHDRDPGPDRAVP